MTAPMRVRTYGVTNDCFEEICTTLDVSRDGILFTTTRRGYRPGQQLAVAFPYSPGPSAINTDQKAEVVRVTDLPGGQRAVAVKLLGAMPVIASKDAGRAAAPSGGASRRNREPAAQPARGSAAALATGDAPAQRRVVLAVRLEPDLQSALCAHLAPEGYDVPSAATTAEVGAVLGQAAALTIAIIDVSTDSASGYKLCREIKSSPQLAHVPVILITENNDPTAYAEVSRGAVMCIARPVPPERLLQLVRLLAPPPARGSAYSGREAGRSGVEHDL